MCHPYTDEQSGMVHIVMEYFPDANLDIACERCSEAQKVSVISQLRGYLELPQIKRISCRGIDGFWFNCHYFDGDHRAYGPFANEVISTCELVKTLRKAPST